MLELLGFISYVLQLYIYVLIASAVRIAANGSPSRRPRAEVERRGQRRVFALGREACGQP